MMSLFRKEQLYTENHLSLLAQAMGVNRDYLWIDPVNNALSLKDFAREEIIDDHDDEGDEVEPVV